MRRYDTKVENTSAAKKKKDEAWFRGRFDGTTADGNSKKVTNKNKYDGGRNTDTKGTVRRTVVGSSES